MTKSDWAIVEEHLKNQFNRVTLICDGYRLTLQLCQIKKMELAICIWINGQMKGSWHLEDCEERRRFFWPRARHHWSAKSRKALKGMGAKHLKSNGIDLNEIHIIHYPWWKSFRFLKAHLIKNNASIELVDN